MKRTDRLRISTGKKREMGKEESGRIRGVERKRGGGREKPKEFKQHPKYPHGRWIGGG